MKKLLYTLFAFAIIVACEKDMDDNASYSINPIEAEVSNIDMDTNLLIDSIIDRLSTNGISVPSTKGSASTARTTLPACAEDTRDGLTIGGSSDYISYEFAVINGSNYGILRSEAETPLAAFTPVVSISFVNLGSGNVGIYVGADQVVVLNIPAFGPLFDNSLLGTAFVENLDAAFIYTSDSSTTAAGLACMDVADPTWGESAPGSGLWQLFAADGTTLMGSYQISDAPFPLTGKLATRMTNATSHTVNHYAGSEESDVRDAIEDDFAGR